MSVKLYVGNLNYRTTSDGLKDLFAQAGEVLSAQVITDRASGRSKGFGFIEFETEAEAEKAIELLHDKDFEGRQIIVNKARPMEERPPRRDFRSGGGTGGGYGGGGFDRR